MSNTRNYLGQDINTENLTPSASETQKGLVQLASTAEALGISNALKALTPAGLGEVLGTGLLSGNGYMKIPVNVAGVLKEIIVQWGSVSTAASGVANITLPIPFPETNSKQFCNVANSSSTQTSFSAAVGPSAQITKTAFQIVISSASVVAVNWMAIGW